MVSTNKNYFLLFTNTAQFIQEPLTLRLNIFSTAEVMCMCNSSLCCWWSFWMVVLVVLLFHHHYFKWIFSCQLIRFFFVVERKCFLNDYHYCKYAMIWVSSKTIPKSTTDLILFISLSLYFRCFFLIYNSTPYT